MAIVSIVLTVVIVCLCIFVYITHMRFLVIERSIKSIKESTNVPKGFGTTVGVHERTITEHEDSIEELKKKIFKLEFVLKSRGRHEEKVDKPRVVIPVMDGWVRENL